MDECHKEHAEGQRGQLAGHHGSKGIAVQPQVAGHKQRSEASSIGKVVTGGL